MTATMEDLIQSFHGNAHVSQDLKALQDYLAQTLKPSPLYMHSPSTSYPAAAPSRSTSKSRYPTSLPTFSHEAYHHGHQPYASPLIQTPAPVPPAYYPGEDPAESSASASMSGNSGARPYALRRSSSYGFSEQQIPTPARSDASDTSDVDAAGEDEAMSFSFQGDAFAPLVAGAQEDSLVAADPWARLRQAQTQRSFHQSAFGQFGVSANNPPAAAAAGCSSGGAASGSGTLVFQQHARAQIGGLGRYQSPVRSRVERPPTPPDEDDEMMDAELAEQLLDFHDESASAVGVTAQAHRDVIRAECAPGAGAGDFASTWRNAHFSAWDRGRQ